MRSLWQSWTLTATAVTGFVLAAAFTSSGCDSNRSPTSLPASQPSAKPGEGSTTGSQPAPAAVTEMVRERLEMVEHQIQNPTDREPITDERVLEAMRAVPRHVFVPRDKWRLAYTDQPLPIGHDQTISQPYIVALMTQALQVTPDSKVLEVGTGSGYQAAVLAHLTPNVYTIEILIPLYQRAVKVLREQGYTQVQCRRGDGYNGWPEAAPFDRILVTFAAEQVPEPLWEQLKPGGLMIMPIGGQGQQQRLEVFTKTTDGRRISETITAVRFVPMTREK